MLLSSKTNTASVETEALTADADKIVLGGGFRLPANTADKGKIRLGGGFRLPDRGA